MANLNIRNPELYSEILQTKDRAEAEANFIREHSMEAPAPYVKPNYRVSK